jgi:hypothetical protein
MGQGPTSLSDAEWLTEQVAALAKKWSRKPAAKRARAAPGLTARYSPDAHTWPAHQRFTELALCVADAGIQIDLGRVWNAAALAAGRTTYFTYRRMRAIRQPPDSIVLKAGPAFSAA